MLRESLSKSLCALGLLGAIALPSIAHAEEVTVALHEDEGGVTLQIRGVEGDSHDQVITSKTGALLFVPGTEATAQRLHPMGKHRLHFVQIGRAGERVAVRVVQRKAARGNLSKHIESVSVPGGFDVRIADGIGAPPVADTVAALAPAAIAPAAALAPAFDREAALDKLAGPAPTATTVAAPLPATVEVTAPAPAQQVAAAATTPAAAGHDVADEAPLAQAAAVAEPAAAEDGGARWAAATTQNAPMNLRADAPRVGMAWLATAMLAFSGLGFMWWRRRRPSFAAPDALRVVARVSIGPKQQIIWLSAGGRTLLVGATEHRIELLADLDSQAPSAPAQNPADPLGLFPPTLTNPITAPCPAPVASTSNAAGNGQRVAAFKQRLRAALGDELSGRNVEPEPSLPPHLEMLTAEPRWARKDAA